MKMKKTEWFGQVKEAGVTNGDIRRRQLLRRRRDALLVALATNKALSGRIRSAYSAELEQLNEQLR